MSTVKRREMKKRSPRQGQYCEGDGLTGEALKDVCEQPILVLMVILYRVSMNRI